MESTEYAALKFIEALYQQGLIKPHVWRNILREHAKHMDVTPFAVERR